MDKESFSILTIESKKDLFKSFIKKKDIGSIKTVLKDKLICPSFDNDLSIRLASLYGCTEIFELLLNIEEVDPCNNGNTALINAASNDHIEIVRLLLNNQKFKKRIKKAASLALVYADVYEKNDIVELLWKEKDIQNDLMKNNLILYNKLNKRYVTKKINDF
jgi:ankyrin repeat protein